MLRSSSKKHKSRINARFFSPNESHKCMALFAVRRGTEKLCLCTHITESCPMCLQAWKKAKCPDFKKAEPDDGDGVYVCVCACVCMCAFACVCACACACA